MGPLSFYQGALRINQIEESLGTAKLSIQGLEHILGVLVLNLVLISTNLVLFFILIKLFKSFRRN
ncbi:hypothetical protein KA107_03110 [Candidatus Pacearchaeota archaeon]|nr:hypothetical protein [Candidatus Pacearchaeota archaeon]